MFPAWDCPARSSTLLNIVASLLDINDRVATIARKSLRPLVAHGHNMEFWKDNWMNQGSLRNYYPRIFTLAESKNGPIENFEH